MPAEQSARAACPPSYKAVRPPEKEAAMKLRSISAGYALALSALALAGAAQPEPAPTDDDGFHRVQRPGSVDLATEYDLTNLSIPEGEIHTLLPRDAIPSLTDPRLVPISEGDWLAETDRVISVVIGDEAVAAPFKILNFHEIVNMTVGGEAVAATYCPLCDSATLVSRIVPTGETDDQGEPETITLDLGVSGALYNSNVLMYDRQTMGLWSQLAMRAVSGPLAGTPMTHLPLRVVSWRAFKSEHPDGKVVSRDTGYQRPYDRVAYAGYFATDDLMVPVRGVGDAIDKKKTLGLGVLSEGQAWFIPSDVIGDRYELSTPAGPVIARATDAGVEVLSAPEGVHTAQTYYYSWSAFNPDVTVLTK